MYVYTENDNINHELRAKYEKMSMEEIERLMFEEEEKVKAAMKAHE